MSTRWAILTGEYPPQPGGVSDYTRLVAAGLVAAGDAVAIYAPRCATDSPPDPGVSVVRLPDHFGPRGLYALDRALARTKPDRILVQYAPHAYGCKAMNLPFAAWVATRARALAPVWVMFHEVAFPFSWRPAKYALLAATHRVMARLVAGAAARVFASIPGWEPLIRRCSPRTRAVEWLGVPCTVGGAADPALVAAVRGRFAPGGGPLVGHFGTFGPPITDLLEPAAAALLRLSPPARLLLLGRGSDRFLKTFAVANPDLAVRVSATGELPSRGVAAHVRACDLLLQPYPDGVSSRRTSVMTGLANGVPVATNLGHLSEPLWATTGCVGLADRPDPDALANVAAALLADAGVRRGPGTAGRRVYDENFSLEHVVARLRTTTPP